MKKKIEYDEKTKEAILLLDNILQELDYKFRSVTTRKSSGKLDFDKIYLLMKDADQLLHMIYDVSVVECGIRCRKFFLPLINLLLKIERDKERKVLYYKMLEETYRLSARTNFEHFVIYYEWEDTDKFFEPRYEILNAYAYFLNRMVFDEDFEMLIVNLPSGTGKTYLEKLSEAFGFGVDATGTNLYLCSNDDVVKGGSRTVLETIKSERFGNVFPNMRYEKTNREYFLKETEGEWKLKDCKLVASYYAKTTQSNVVGCRASKTIHIDDLYADYKEALDENLNIYFYNKYVTVWRKRYVQNKKPKVIVTGTMWSPTDFIVRVIDQTKRENKFIPHPKFRYVQISEDGKKVIIQIPALDYETDESTCEALWSTESLIRERASMDRYLWETNFQQVPTSPEGLEFDWNNIRTYDKLLISDAGTYAVIDGTRKSGKDYFAMPIFQPFGETDYNLIDCIFTKIASSELVGAIVDKMIERNIRTLVIESNVDGGLKKLIENEFEKRNIQMNCNIIEKYSTAVKSTRIELEKGIIKKRIRFPDKTLFGGATDMGKFMENLTMYNSIGTNKNDDAPDSVAMFTSEIIAGKSRPRKAKAVQRLY